jgi:hypothetical protein
VLVRHRIGLRLYSHDSSLLASVHRELQRAVVVADDERKTLNSTEILPLVLLRIVAGYAMNYYLYRDLYERVMKACEGYLAKYFPDDQMWMDARLYGIWTKLQVSFTNEEPFAISKPNLYSL